MRICFVDKTDFCYDADSIYSPFLRGAETVLINLSNNLNLIGHSVTVINNCKENKLINNVRWINLNCVKIPEEFDLVIANGDCRLFKFAKSNKNILFSHSIQTIEKFIRKKQFLSYLKFKPKICFISKYHKDMRSKLLYLFGSINLRWSVDEIFLKSKISNFVDNEQAIFTSNKDRNLNLLINIWKKNIFPKNRKLKLFVNSEHDNEKNFQIFKRNLGDQRDLIADLQKSRLFLIPGHKAELFCLAAEEAKELCLPIVTMGIGCLKERVEHGITGFVARNNEEFANYTLEIFKNNNLWNFLRNNLIKKRSSKTWGDVARDLVSQI